MSRLTSVIQIGAAPAQVFSLLRETRSWPNWWRGVSHAKTADLRPLREGSDLELTFIAGPLRLGSRGRVHMVTDERLLAWRAPLAGVALAWTFSLHPSPRGTRLEMALDLPLPMTLLRWCRLEAWWSKSTARSLRRLKELAERL